MTVDGGEGEGATGRGARRESMIGMEGVESGRGERYSCMGSGIF